MNLKQQQSAPIESYALIGDCETAALVGLDGSIDWLCWPNFSSGACFARLLGSRDNGCWVLAPAGKVTAATRKYRDHTLILETTFEAGDAVVALIDFMPVRDRNSHIVRIVQGVRGTMAMTMQLILRFDYGYTIPWVTSSDHTMKAIAGPDMVVLRTAAPLQGEGLTTVSRFTVQQGESVEFVMTYGPSHLRLPGAIDVGKALNKTEAFWKRWTARCSYNGPYRDTVERSLITLKALTYRPTGGMVAAVTTSLPEQSGSSRNWDYRYCWLRDATFTLLALINGGYYTEAKEWQEWLMRAVAGSPDQAQIMYGISGQRHLLEWEIPGLEGYENSKPVRVGNAASQQLQLDIYGELMDAFFHTMDRLNERKKRDFRILEKMVDHLGKIWADPDEGIWETRGGRANFTYSKVMAWVAFDRAIKAAGKLHAGAPVERWQKLRAKIHEDVCTKGYSEKLGSFVQTYGSDLLDASLLLIPLVGFLPPEDERVKGTVRAIEQKLMPGGLVMRYDTGKSDDGLPPGEGVFLACSFWMVSNLKLQGREEEARRLFEKVLALANDVGLLSEEYDTVGKRLVGNFPQAFSHIALVNAAYDLAGHPGSRHQCGNRKPQKKSSHAKPVSSSH